MNARVNLRVKATKSVGRHHELCLRSHTCGDTKLNLLELAKRHSKTFGGLTPAIWVISDLSELSYDRLLTSESEASRELIAKVAEMARRYRKGEPLQYILGHWSFRELDLVTDTRGLIPRPETEMLPEFAIAMLGKKRGAIAADLGTGTGAIGLSLAASGRFAWVHMTDVSLATLSLASLNVDRNRSLLRSPVFMSRGSWFKALPDRRKASLDLVVSNPPYIASGAIAKLDSRVLFEPRVALDGGVSGMTCLLEILAGAPEYLKAGGAIVLEMGEEQGDSLSQVAESFGYRDVEIRQDATKRPRFLTARWPG